MEDLRRSGFNFIAHGNFAGLEDGGAPSSMAAHGIVTSVAERLFHPRAWGTYLGELEDGTSYEEGCFLKGNQVDARDDDISAEEIWGETVSPHECCDDRKVFGLDQGHGALALSSTVAFEAALLDLDGLHLHHVRPPFWPYADPGDLALGGVSGHHVGKIGQSVSSTMTISRSDAVLAMATPS